jgi:hypothetical protein
LRLLPLVFTRPGELRAMEWAEVDFEAAQAQGGNVLQFKAVK